MRAGIAVALALAFAISCAGKSVTHMGGAPASSGGTGGGGEPQAGGTNTAGRGAAGNGTAASAGNGAAPSAAGTAGSVGRGGSNDSGGQGGGRGGSAGSSGDSPGDAGEPGRGGAPSEGGAGSGPVVCGGERSGQVTLEHQGDVEELRGVSTIVGSVFITGDVSDLTPLQCLSEITYDFQITEASKLATLEGLEKLTRIGGAFSVGWGCDWESVDCVGNPSLRSIDALSSLTSAASVYITSNCAAEDGPCSRNTGLERVVFAQLSTTAHVSLYGNPALKEARFDSLEAVDEITVADNASLDELSFGSLTVVNHFLSLDDNPSLPNLAAFSKLTRVVDGLSIIRSNFANLAGFENLESTSFLYFYDNPLLTSLTRLSSVTWLPDLIIQRTALRDLRGLEPITVLGRLMLVDNTALETLDGVENVAEIGSLDLIRLPSLHDLSAVGTASTLYSLNIDTCPLMTTLMGLPPVTNIETVHILDNVSLTSLDGLEGVERLGSLHVRDNTALGTLGLTSLERLSYDLEIVDNPVLPTCEATGLRDRVGAQNIFGIVTISGNDDGGTCAR